ncbi:dTDP-4-dehydrorhamnose reductase [Pusillimonas sp. CC-YST705]|uniref:dTDP-4-dehydrorhamnose reductase n=1 Tax=Mesopusillimonas faecipullorum TaxID=2755040 RepID=A0ABS8CDK7_9BURK|nr:dTDP-4-dehydrorhamnose reductase [Mesopusillimonas faecipullorum]MCB5364118.1 dTDP-4-dehydrorhamnose reductase [Mesopusillimonas faecipullorum]
MTPCRVLLTGAQGQLGRSLQARAPRHWHLHACAHHELDVGDEAAVQAYVLRVQPNLIINAAAYNAVDAAQTDEECWRVNALGPGYLARAANSVGARLLHVSSDYVFDGLGEQPFDEGHTPNPLNRYGASKLAGELAVLEHAPQALVLRTSWVFSEFDGNFVSGVLTRAWRGGELRMADYQFGAPTYAGHLAAAIIRLLQLPQAPGGVYHYRDSPAISRYDYAHTILELAAQPLEGVQVSGLAALIPASEAEQPSDAAPRPRYTVLGCARLTALGIASQSWLPALRSVVQARYRQRSSEGLSGSPS